MIVLDASAAVDLLLANTVGARVGQLVGQDDVVAPELIDVEVSSALARLVRTGALPEGGATARIRALQRMPVQRVPHRPLTARAWELRDRVRVSDAFYVACAELVGGTLLTTDGRLGRAALSGLAVMVVT